MVIGIGFVFPALCEGVFGFRVSGLFWCGSGWSFPVGYEPKCGFPCAKPWILLCVARVLLGLLLLRHLLC